MVDTADAAQRVSVLGRRGVLVLSSRPFAELERWAALDVQAGGDGFAMEPADAFEV